MKTNGTELVFECSGRSISYHDDPIRDITFSPINDASGTRIAIGELHEVFPIWDDRLTPEERSEFGLYMAKMWTEWAEKLEEEL